jgi:PIN domain nuclease of toxin-antitoxin system
MILDPDNQRWISPISLLEIALKVRIGKLILHKQFSAIFPGELLANDIAVLPLETAHVESLTTLPMHHRDPFNRLLACTALMEGPTLVSKDVQFEAYGVSRAW